MKKAHPIHEVQLTKMLRSLIQETLKMRVLAQYVDINPNTNQEADHGDMIEAFIDEDDGDEVSHLLNKYGKPVPTFSPPRYPKKGGVTQKVQGRLKRTMVPGKGWQLSDENVQVIETCEQLFSHLNNPQQQKQNGERLVEVIEPWKLAGWDIIGRLHTINKKGTTQPFPFFQTTPVIGGSVPFPTTPSKRVIDIIATTQPKVGGLQTGRGELLFALMTGGIAGDREGDVNVAGKLWEVKDVPGNGVARLGGKASSSFLSYFTDANVKGTGAANAADFVKQLHKQLGVSHLMNNQAAVDVINDALNEIFMGIVGFVLVKGEIFEFVDKNDMELFVVASDNRVHVRQNPSKSASSSASTGASTGAGGSGLGGGPGMASDEVGDKK